MRGKVLTIVAAAGLIGALVIPALGSAAATTLTAKLKGSEEVPGPGDPNGRGEAFIAVNVKKKKVCFEITHEKIQNPTAGHIHKGKDGVAGPIKVALFEGGDSATGVPSPIEDCVKPAAKRKVLRRIKNHPENHYVNLHNTAYPDGAIRGQLELGL